MGQFSPTKIPKHGSHFRQKDPKHESVFLSEAMGTFFSLSEPSKVSYGFEAWVTHPVQTIYEYRQAQDKKSLFFMSGHM